MTPTMLFSHSIEEPMQSMGLKEGDLVPVGNCDYLPKSQAVRTASSNLMMREGSGTKTTGALHVNTSLSLDLSSIRREADAEEQQEEEDREEEFNAGDPDCETPKSNQCRIPDVDIDSCPQAPKKSRGTSRLALLGTIECENCRPMSKADLRLQLSPCYLF
uniref:Uncharacterized protein n=1 Tax=Physcomitrium patens TaxID=3218 RepID=A9TFP8_PHYPA|nr:hypothetical protein PHYPA_012022 [Physcomitrium patens]